MPVNKRHPKPFTRKTHPKYGGNPSRNNPIVQASHTRNRCKGQVSMALACCRSVRNSGVVSISDKSALNSCIINLLGIIDRWDPHYISKLHSTSEE